MAGMLKLNDIATAPLGRATLAIATSIASLVCLCAKAFQWSKYPSALALCRRHQARPYYTVCLHDVATGEHYRKLQECCHCFHAECIDAWFDRRDMCPLCRSHVAGVCPPCYEGGRGRSSGVILGFLSLSQRFFGKGVVVPGRILGR